MCGGCNDAPASGRRNEEDVLLRIGILILHIVFIRHEFRVAFLKLIGDVFKENQSKNDVLVLRRVHIAAENIRSLPNLFLETYYCRTLFFSHTYFLRKISTS